MNIEVERLFSQIDILNVKLGGLDKSTNEYEITKKLINLKVSKLLKIIHGMKVK